MALNPSGCRADVARPPRIRSLALAAAAIAALGWCAGASADGGWSARFGAGVAKVAERGSPQPQIGVCSAGLSPALGRLRVSFEAGYLRLGSRLVLQTIDQWDSTVITVQIRIHTEHYDAHYFTPALRLDLGREDFGPYAIVGSGIYRLDYRDRHVTSPGLSVGLGFEAMERRAPAVELRFVRILGDTAPPTSLVVATVSGRFG